MSDASSRHAAPLPLLVLAALLAMACPTDDVDDGVASIESGNDSGPGSTDTTAANGTTADSTGGTGESGDLIMNACGTFDPNKPGDSAIPQDPDDPELVEACTALCEAIPAIPDCTIDPAECLEACTLRSCGVCPGTLAPLVTCETEMVGTTECTCGESGVVCSTPEGCADQLDATSQCGG